MNNLCVISWGCVCCGIFSKQLVGEGMNKSLCDIHVKPFCSDAGPCSCFSSIPWSTGRMGSNDVDTQDWRLLTAHDSGKLLLWDPGLKSLQPLLEIEFRKSPIRHVNCGCALVDLNYQNLFETLLSRCVNWQLCRWIQVIAI